MVFAIVELILELCNEDLNLFHTPLKDFEKQEQSPAFAAFKAVIVVPGADLLESLQRCSC